MATTLDRLKQLAHGIAMQFGSGCEVVIHNVKASEIEGSIVCIENGEISERKVGDGPSHVVLDALKHVDGKLEDRYSYLTKTKDGRIFRSTTMYIRDDNDELAYVCGINFDITDFLNLQSAVNNIVNNTNVQDKPVERITTSVSDLLDDLVEHAETLVGKPAAAMNKNERMTAIKYLNDAGAFLISKSTDKIAEYFGVSKFTLYSDINTVKDTEED